MVGFMYRVTATLLPAAPEAILDWIFSTLLKAHFLVFILMGIPFLCTTTATLYNLYFSPLAKVPGLGFSNTNLKAMEPILHKNIDTFILKVRTELEEKGKIEVYYWLELAMTNILGEVCYVKDFGLIDIGGVCYFKPDLPFNAVKISA
ncbi:hypothetical protein EYR41_008876 [Orbilia oligospora]|uniref:Uncharacterized protein n=1 Tax=Orbilia oligospora TaxID=2813651 RepID=A0A8H2DQD7_ORBOL|nr:hypothetical protein EYR41_008876 [Orbilia oligospora]